MPAKTYRVSAERADGITVSVAIAIPDYTPDAAEFSELAQIALVQAEKVVDRNLAQRAEANPPF